MHYDRGIIRDRYGRPIADTDPETGRIQSLPSGPKPTGSDLGNVSELDLTTHHGQASLDDNPVADRMFGTGDLGGSSLGGSSLDLGSSPLDDGFDSPVDTSGL